MSGKPSKIVYIISDNRSGSTLLEQLLAANRRVTSVGEIHHLAAYALQDRRLFDPQQPLVCTCGAPISECDFWMNVESELGQPLHSLRLRLRLLGASGPGHVSAFSQKLVKRYFAAAPRRFRYSPVSTILGARRVGTDSFALFDSISAVSHVDYIIDSSKSAYRFRALYEYQPRRMMVVSLVRDYRATVHSKMKRGRDLHSSINGWVRRMREMHDMTDDVPESQRLSLRHEDLCEDPASVMQGICNFLSIDYCNDMLTRPSVNIHGLGGSPSKFDPAMREIQLDRSYLDAFSDTELATMKRIAGKTAAEWGYD